MRFQVPLKTFRLDGWITLTQRIRQWVPNCQTGDWVSPGAKCAATKPRNIQFATDGRAEMLAAGYFGDWHAAVGKVLWSSVPKTLMNSRGKLVPHLQWDI